MGFRLCYSKLWNRSCNGSPSGDQRDYDFAKKFGLEIKNIFKIDISKSAFEEKAILL